MSITSIHRYVKSISPILLSWFVLNLSNAQVVNVVETGAKGDGRTLNTVSIQKAIDKVASTGGGTVQISNGIYLTGSIFLKSNVTLKIEAGATLLGSSDIGDYKELSWGHNADRQPYHLIVASDCKNITIEGKGTIDGNGQAFWQEYEKDNDGVMVIPRWLKPKDKKVSPLIEIVNCQNITLRDVTVKTGGGWNIHLFNCDLAKISSVNIINSLYSPNSDGIDITGCNDIIISDCFIKTCDDAICLKTTEDSRECHRITVTNCILETLCVGLKMGCNESVRDMTDVTFSNCIVNKSSRAIGIYVKAGATYDRINISNITANTNAPLIFNRPVQIMVNQLTDTSKLGIIRNVIISNFTCETEGRILLTCQDGGLIENITLRDIILRYPMIEDPRPMLSGSGSSQFPKAKDHPEAVGALAAVVADNISNLIIDNLHIQWPVADDIPQAWKHPERIENGSMRIHRFDYSRPKQAEFSAFWGNKLKGGYIFAPIAKASSLESIKYVIKNSNFEVIK